MRIIVVGLGVQGQKRAAVAGADVVATVDPARPGAAYRDVAEVPPDRYDAALVCTPDDAKPAIVAWLLERGKHVLVEKPLRTAADDGLSRLAALAAARRAACYTAYNHRFEPHVARMKALLGSGELGRIYRCRLFYGNGTAADVRSSPWRDRGDGVLGDLGSHLLDLLRFWFGPRDWAFRPVALHRFENAAFDHAVVAGEGEPAVELEVTLLSWRNHFTCDVLAERGSAHIESLCKWGPSTFIRRRRVLPSGRPDEEAVTLVQADPTWAAEYEHFKALCRQPTTTLENDLWIDRQLRALTAGAMAGLAS